MFNNTHVRKYTSKLKSCDHHVMGALGGIVSVRTNCGCRGSSMTWAYFLQERGPIRGLLTWSPWGALVNWTNPSTNE